MVVLSLCSPPLSPREIKVGDPNDPNNMLGALISKEHMAKVKGYINLARSEGCRIMCGDGEEQLDLPQQNRNVGAFSSVSLDSLYSACTHLAGNVLYEHRFSCLCDSDT